MNSQEAFSLEFSCVELMPAQSEWRLREWRLDGLIAG
jgi:hypothetical protein